MVEFSPDVKRRLDELRATFVAGLPDRVAAIVAAYWMTMRGAARPPAPSVASTFSAMRAAIAR